MKANRSSISPRLPEAPAGLIRNIITRQETMPSRQVCQEKSWKVGLPGERASEREVAGTAPPSPSLLGLEGTAGPTDTPTPQRALPLPLGKLHPPEVGCRGPLQRQAGQVHGGVGDQIEDGHDASNGVEFPHQEHQLGKAGVLKRGGEKPPHLLPVTPGSPAPPGPDHLLKARSGPALLSPERDKPSAMLSACIIRVSSAQ